MSTELEEVTTEVDTSEVVEPLKISKSPFGLSKNDLSKNRRDLLDKTTVSYVELKQLVSDGEIKLLEQVKGSAKRTMYGSTLAFFLGLTSSTLYSPVMNTLNEHLGYSDVSKQFVNASPNLTGALLRIPAGIFLEKFSSKTIHLVLMVTTFIGLLPVVIIALTMYPKGYDHQSSTLFYVFILCGLICGAGTATFSCGIPTVGFWYPKSKQGIALGFYAGFGNLSPAVWNILMPNISNIIGIEGMYLVWLVWLGWAIYVAYDNIEDNPFTQLKMQHNKLKKLHPDWDLPKFNEERAKVVTNKKYHLEKFPTGNIVDSMIGSIKLVPVVLLIITYIVSFGGFLALVAYLPTYWDNAFGFGTTNAGLCTFTFAVLASTVRYVGGIYSDKYGGIFVGYIAIILALIASVMLLFSNTFGLSFCAIIIAGCAHGISNGAHFKVVPLICGNYFSGASAWIGSIGASGGFFLPIIMADIAAGYDEEKDKEYYQMPWALFVALWVMSIFLWYIVSRYTPKFVKDKSTVEEVNESNNNTPKENNQIND